MNSVKYIGMDVHKEAISVAVLNSSGKLVMECTIETKAITILDFLKGLRGSLHVTLEEGTWAAWLYDLIKPHVTELVVCNPRRNALLKEGSKSDRIDARKLAELLRSNMLRPVYHGENGVRTLTRAGAELSDDQHRSDPSDESREGDLPQLGDRLCGEAGLCTERHRLGVARARSRKPACDAERSSTTSSSMRCGPCARKCGANCWPRPRSTTPGNCYARFRSSARSGRRC